MYRWLVIFAAVAGMARAGGGPQNVLVVVNDNSAASLELGQYYQDARGIPERNVCHVSTTTNYTLSPAAFSNEIEGPVRAHLEAQGLSNQIDYIVVSRDIPYQVGAAGSTNSLTAALFYGFRTNAAFPCSIPGSFTRSDYFAADRGFAHGGVPSSNRYYITSLLVSTNTDSAKRLVDRSVGADNTQPTGTVFLFHAPDARNAQWPQFEDAAFQSRFFDAVQPWEIVDGYYFSPGRTNVMGVMASQCCGLPTAQTGFRPGALADHFTSFGGVLYEPSGQQSILEWIAAGAAGASGTIIEPCVFTQKFPHARLHTRYAYGFSLGESYAMSIMNPYETVLVGDPLCAPYAQPPTVYLGGLATGQTVTGVATLSITGMAAGAQGRVERLDLFLDGIALGAITTAPPRAMNEVVLTVNGSTYTQAVASGQEIFAVASNLAALVNANTGVSARAYGDRIEMRQRALGVPGTGIVYSASTALGGASELNLAARSAGSNFAETVHHALEGVALSGVAVSGDVVRAVVTRLDSVVVTNEAMAVSNGTPAIQLLTQLRDAVNADPNLDTASGCKVSYLWNPPAFGFSNPPEAYFAARTNTWEGHNLFLDYLILTNAGSTLAGPGFSDNFNDNASTLGARGVVFLAAGQPSLVASYTLATTNLPDGPHELMAVAYDGSAVMAQGRVTIPFVVDNNSITCRLDRPVSGQYVLRGNVMTAEASVAGATVTQVSFYAEGKLLASTNAPPYVWVLATTNYGAGMVEFQARGDGPSGAALSDKAFVNMYSDDDADGVSDQWEYRHFGSAAMWGDDDPDGDGVGNAGEFLADTDPTNGAEFLRVVTWQASATGPAVRVHFSSGTTRTYRVDVNAVALTNAAAWAEATNFSRGADGTTTWENVLSGTTEFYRVRALLP
jgi:uncharacterized protein (TIGR03790 family)